MKYKFMLKSYYKIKSVINSNQQKNKNCMIMNNFLKKITEL